MRSPCEFWTSASLRLSYTTHLALEALVNNVRKQLLWASYTALFLLQGVLWLLFSDHVAVPLVHCCLGNCGGGLDLLERSGGGAVLVRWWGLGGWHRLKQQGLLL